MNGEIDCPGCGMSATPARLDIAMTFDDVAVYSCPVCGHELAPVDVGRSDGWILFVEDDASTRPNREARAEVYRSGGILGTYDIVAYRMTGTLRRDRIDDDSSMMDRWSLYRSAADVDEILAVLPDDLPVPSDADQWLLWRYI